MGKTKEKIVKSYYDKIMREKFVSYTSANTRQQISIGPKISLHDLGFSFRMS
jgi:hypothetical protein